MPVPLAPGNDLVSDAHIEASLLRPLTDDERAFIQVLIMQVSAKLRQRLPGVDDRMAAHPDGENSVDPVAVSAMLADVVSRRLLNPRRLWSTGGESAGPFAAPSETYAGARSGQQAQSFGNLEITDADLAQLTTGGGFNAPRTIRTAPTRWVG